MTELPRQRSSEHRLRNPSWPENVALRLFPVGVFSLWLGGIGGSYQPSRLIILLGLAVLATNPRGVVLVRSAGPVYLAYVSIIMLGVMTLPLTPNFTAGVSLIVTVALGMCAVLLITREPTIGDARRVRDAWAIGLLVTLVFAVYEIVTGKHFAFALEGRNAGGDIGDLPYSSVFFGNYNDYSTYICLAYPMLLGALLEKASIARRSTLLLASAVCVAVTVINTSRIAMVFVAVASLFAALAGKRRNIFWLLALSVGVLEGVRASGFDWQYARYRLTTGLLVDDQRSGLIGAGVDALIRTFGFGLGPAGFVTFAERRYPHLIPNPHNMLIEFAVNFTLLSAVAFVALLGFLFVRAARNSALPMSVRFPALVTLPFIPLIGSMSSSAVGYTYWWYWLASALFISGLNRRRIGDRSARRGSPQRGRGQLKKVTVDGCALSALSGEQPVTKNPPVNFSGRKIENARVASSSPVVPVSQPSWRTREAQ